MNTPTPAQDYGEPWRESTTLDYLITEDDREILYNASSMHEPYRSRAITCVNACSGMADPEKEIQEMRDAQGENASLLRLLADIRAAVGDPQGKLMQDKLVTHYREMREDLKLAYSYLQSIEECLGSLARIGRMPTGGENSGNWEHCVQSHKFANDALAKLTPYAK